MKNISPKKDPLFSPASFFLVRTPLLPIEEFFALLEAEDISVYLLNLFKSNFQIQEAFAVASPTLFDTLQQISMGTELRTKKIEQAISSLFKYVLRMSSRATPFGLFSFVSLGAWDTYATSHFDLSQLKKRARPDMEWLMHMIDQMALDIDHISQFPLKRNPLLYESMDRVILPISRKKDKTQNQISIRANPLVRLILSLTYEPIAQNELIRQVLDQLPTLDSEKIAQVIHSLRQQEILCPTLYPTLLTHSPFDDLILHLKHFLPNSPLLPELDKIKQLLTNYNETSVGDGGNTIKYLWEAMKKNDLSSSLLQVDMISHQEIQLPSKIASELAESVEVFWKFSSMKQGVPFLRSYHEKFLDRYGTFRTVPVLELLDDTVGLGIPQSYLTTKEEIQKDLPWESWLIEQLACCIRENKTEIELTEEIVQRFTKEIDLLNAPSSFDVFFEIAKETSTDHTLVLNSISDMSCGCATMGRFTDMFNEKDKAKVENFMQEESLLNPHAILAEISYFPSSARSANVAIHPNFRSFVMDLGYGKSAENKFCLEDVYVGATSHHLYLTFKTGNKNIIFNATNVLDFTKAPIPVRFLRDVSRDHIRPFSFITWGNAEKFPFIPSLRYKNTKLSSAKWRISLAQIGATEKDTHETLIQKIGSWATMWHLPRFVSMLWADNHILLDRTHPFHLKEIAHRLKNDPKSSVILMEKIGTEEWVQSEKGRHRSEFVLPFHKNKHYFSPSIPITTFASIPTSSRWEIPGGEWLFAKIYLPRDNEARFLTLCLAPFIKEIKEVIEKWFFIRYKEGEASHIRLRCQAKDLDNRNLLLKKFHAWSDTLMQKGWIKDIQLSSYEREVERYGGEMLMEKAEAFFQTDSEACLSLLQLIILKKCPFPEPILTALSLIGLLDGFGLSLEQQAALFSQMELNTEHLEGFREWKVKLLSMISVFQQKDLSSVGEELYPLFKIFQERKEKQQIYAKALQNVPHATSILQSLAHMHCNRLMGIDNLLEQKAYNYAYQALSISVRKINKGDI